MALYFLTCDLRKARQFDYQDLHDLLEEMEAVRVLDSTWCFQRFNATAAQLCDYFRKYLDADDGLVVSEAGDWATYKVRGSPGSLPEP